MNVINQVYPTFEQLTALTQDAAPGPIVMVNLLRFRDRAAYADGRSEAISGRDAYMRYAVDMRPIVETAGGRILFSGDLADLVIGQVEEPWDAVAIVEYPSRAAFHRIATSPEVQAIGVHREAGLAGQLLILSTELKFPAPR
jgi:uncharacterized protein (DUF1330 family)